MEDKMKQIGEAIGELLRIVGLEMIVNPGLSFGGVLVGVEREFIIDSMMEEGVDQEIAEEVIDNVLRDNGFVTEWSGL